MTQKLTKIIDLLSKLYPEAETELIFNDRYQLVVSVVLSAQCTDKRVNIVTEKLFAIAPTPQKMLELSTEQLEQIIYPCGFFRAKAKSIMSLSKSIIEDFGGQVPDTKEGLISLKGVGEKTAAVVLSVGFNVDAIAVDTHVFRVSKRLGIAEGNTPIKVQKDLMRVIDKKLWSKSHHYILWHGRKVCKARKPLCKECTLNSVCAYFAENNPKGK